MKFTMVCLAAVVLAATFLGGCTQFTRQNYEMVQLGDSPARVQDVLGKPEQRSRDLWLYVNTTPYYQAKLHFKNDRLVKKEWFDEENRWIQPEQDERQSLVSTRNH